MINYDTVEIKNGNVRITDDEQWLVITDKVEIDLYPEKSRICAETEGAIHWFLWTDNDLVARVEKAAKETSGIDVKVTDI